MIYLKFNEFNNRKGKITNLFFGLVSDYKIVYKLNIQDADTGKLILDRSGSCAWSAFENDELDFAFNPNESGTDTATISFAFSVYKSSNPNTNGKFVMSSTEEYVSISRYNPYYIDLVKSLDIENQSIITDCLKKQDQSLEEGGNYTHEVYLIPNKLISRYNPINKTATDLQDSTTIIKDKIKMLQLDLEAAQKSVVNYNLYDENGISLSDKEDEFLSLYDSGEFNMENLNTIASIYSGLKTNGVLSMQQSAKYKMVSIISTNLKRLSESIKQESELRNLMDEQDEIRAVE